MILNSPYISGSLTVTGNTTIQGQLTVTGSLSGTASLASNALLLQGTGSTGFATTASVLQVSSSQQQISSSLLQVSASYISLSGSYNTSSGSNSTIITAVSSSQQQISSSLLQVSASYIALSGSYNTFSGSASTRVTQIENVYATTGSNSFRADQSITGSLVVSSTITAQTLVVQTVTSSIVYSSGSNIFGCDLNSRQTFTGSVNITGSLTVNTTGTEFQVTNNGIVMGNLLADNHSVTGSLRVTGSIAIFNTNCTIFGSAPGDFSFNVGTTCVGTNAGIAQFFNNDYTATTRGFIRVRNSATISSTTSAYFGQGQDQKTYFYNNDTSRLGDIVITNTGKVGIGTASPIAQLHIKTDVASASRPTTLATSATNSAAYITTICGSGAGIAFGQLGANTSYIQATYENGSACTSLALNPYEGGVGISTGNNAFSGQKLFIQSNNDQAGITMYNSYDCNMWALATGTSGINNKGFAIRDEINNATRLQFDNCGNVGIGTIVPLMYLNVAIPTGKACSTIYSTAFFSTSPTVDGNPFGLRIGIGGGAAIASRIATLQTTDYSLVDGGSIILQPAAGNVGINNSVPLAALEVGQSCSDQNNGGFAFKTMALADNTWTTFFTPPANWGGLTTLSWVGTNDHNRSGAAQIRWSYQPCAAQLGPTTTIFNDSQNATGYFRYSGGNMQICVDGAGAGKRLQVMIMGSRGA